MLAGFSAAQLKMYVTNNPAAALAAPPRAAGHDPAVNRQWWKHLDQDMRDLFAKELPSLVGNLEGIDYDTRAAANATALALAASQPFATKKQRHAYQNIKQSLSPVGRNVDPRHLMSFDASNPPLAAVAIGNLDSADHVSFNVPGMHSHTADMTGWTDASQNIYSRQTELLPGEDIAVVAWIGYNSPDMISLTNQKVLGMESASVGGRRLATALDGFHTARTTEGDMPFTSVTAHSYGTTTASVALTHTSFDVDTAVFYGSAGLDPDISDNASDLHAAIADDGEPAVYATAATKDYLARGGILGSGFSEDPRSSPTNRDFGAKVFSSEGNGELAPTAGHSVSGEKGATWWDPTDTPEGHGYLDDNTESLDNIARIVSGGGEDVTTTNEAIIDTRIRLWAEAQAQYGY